MPIVMANIRKIRGELQGGRSLSHFGRNVNSYSEGGKLHGVSFKKKLEPPYHPIIPFLGILPKAYQQEKTMPIAMVIAALMLIAFKKQN